jgi:photosystem II stability/assembly factor-like uncharacterized protein
MRFLPLTLLLAAPVIAFGQTATQAPPVSPWQLQESGTTAGLRGIDSVDGTVVWASGTNGTVLRTIDGGAHWTQCATPDAAKDGATLDFRGVQAWDAQTAFIMASGIGKLSRLYKTTNGCKTWKLIFKNPDKEGFWDALYFDQRHKKFDGRHIPWWLDGWILGDPVHGKFSLFSTSDSGKNWFKQKNKGLIADSAAQGAFAASNSSLITAGGRPSFGTGGTGGSFLYSVTTSWICIHCSLDDEEEEKQDDKWEREPMSIGISTRSSGIFSIATRSQSRPTYGNNHVLVAVGGDYSAPNNTSNTVAFKLSHDKPWSASTIPPHGFRSAVQWSESLKLWITVGTNGSDISRDDGKTWQPLDDGNWNALSLPFVVGPNGRIARLNPAALASAK